MPRIIGGSKRGRKLIAPEGTPVRPTSDRAREGLFNVLEHRFDGLDGAKVADLFAGTGALGLEALSRGAASCVFVEQSPVLAKAIKSSLQDMDLEGDVLWQDAGRPKTVAAPYDIVFADPPYDRGDALGLVASLDQAGWLGTETLLVYERDASKPVDWASPVELVLAKKYGRNQFDFLRLESGPSA